MPVIMSSSQDTCILLTRLLHCTNGESWKREIIQQNINRILQKVNQSIYILDTVCEPNIMILAQTVLKIFCWQDSIGLQYISRKRGIIQSNNHRIPQKVNQVI